MECNEKPGQAVVISTGHGLISILTSNLFQSTNPFFPFFPVLTHIHSSSDYYVHLFHNL